MLVVKQIVNSVFNSNSYVIYELGSDYCWLVDIGDWIKIKEFIPFGMSVRGVFLTHTHFDHIYGINFLLKDYPQLIVFTSEYGSSALYSEKQNFSYYHESPIIFKGENVHTLKDGDEIQLYLDEKIIAMETPGHCPSCLTYYTDDFVFTGDSFIPDLPIVTKLPRGNKVLAEKSKIRILDVIKNRKIFAGHNSHKQL